MRKGIDDVLYISHEIRLLETIQAPCTFHVIPKFDPSADSAHLQTCGPTMNMGSGHRTTSIINQTSFNTWRTDSARLGMAQAGQCRVLVLIIRV